MGLRLKIWALCPSFCTDLSKLKLIGQPTVRQYCVSTPGNQHSSNPREAACGFGATFTLASPRHLSHTNQAAVTSAISTRFTSWVKPTAWLLITLDLAKLVFILWKQASRQSINYFLLLGKFKILLIKAFSK